MEIGLFFMCLGRPAFDLVLNCVYRCKRLNTTTKKITAYFKSACNISGSFIFLPDCGLFHNPLFLLSKLPI